MDAELEPVLEDLIASVSPIADFVLARVWILRAGDLCSTCAMAAECPDRRRCLHLAWSGGSTRSLDGPFRRFPLGAREVGRVATHLTPVVHSRDLAGLGLAPREWLELHRVASFGAWPIVSGDRVLGVLAIFSRSDLDAAEAGAIGAAARLAGRAVAAGARSAEREAPKPVATDVSPVAGTMAETQRAAILAALERTRGRVSGAGGAAEVLGMKPTTLESRMRKLGIRKPPKLRVG